MSKSSHTYLGTRLWLWIKLNGHDGFELAAIVDGSFVDDVALLVQNAKSVLLVAEIETDSDGWNFRFHGSVESTTARTRRQSRPSHLILFGLWLLGWLLSI